MEVSGGLLALGIILTMIGVVMVYLSLRADPSDIKTRGVGVIFIGPIPLVISGSGKWVLAALGVAAVIMVIMVVRSFDPNMIGW